MRNKFINREISWLDFNARVLQEAEDSNTPLIERLRFLGIFSNNLDEFFKVRYATIKRVSLSGKSGKKIFGGISADELLKLITKKVINLQNLSSKILDSVYKEMEKQNIFFINEKQVLDHQKEFLRNYFVEKVNPALVTLILSKNQKEDFTHGKGFLIVKLTLDNKDNEKINALIEIPKGISRFIVLPKSGDGNQYIIMLDDLIRYHFNIIFNFFNYNKIEAHMVKVTRDAELDLDEDVSKSYIDKITESVKERLVSDPVRLVYDKEISKSMLELIINKLGIDSKDSLIPGGRYHNRADYMDFPDLGMSDLIYPEFPPLQIKNLSLETRLLVEITKRDFLLHTPYQTFSYVIKFLREAALDPNVTTIKITIYRLSKESNVISALINAAKNGKKVIVQIELQARFDEENNIIFAELLESAGVQLIFGIQGLKVHSKICIIERKEDNSVNRIGFISTGNLNESTAKIYTDFTLFTADQKILKEVNKVFNFLEVTYKIKKYKHLIVSPHNSFSALFRLIDNEIENCKLGKPSGIDLKLNNISNYRIIEKLYQASQAGVKIRMIVRGICCLVPGVDGLSENIEVVSILDRFLEHPRVYVFENSGEKKVFISSADFMTRNLENRVEVSCPVYDRSLQNEIIDVFEISWNDNIKSRLINRANQNKMKKRNGVLNRSQWETYEYYKNNQT
ncbi:MAG: polyphosphate kinase 1 [Flavobacteriaceae bacterium]|nr:polyphosphate kinase 1 [Flavobacteriaceae bacterium]